MAIAGIRKRDDGDRLCPGVDWKGFRGMGNILRHGYHRIDDKIVWDTVKDELPPVKAAVLRALNPPPASPKSPTQHSRRSPLYKERKGGPTPTGSLEQIVVTA
jgi:hypothetical protein